MKLAKRIDSRAALSCHEYLHKKHAEGLFDLTGAILEDPLLDALKKAGGEHEDRVIRYLRELGIPYFQVDKTQSDEGIELQTLDALNRDDFQMIFGASIGPYLELKLHGKEISVRTSRPDIIIRTGTSPEGRPLWAPVDIKSHEAIGENKSNSVYVTKLPELKPDLTNKVTGRLSEKDSLQLAHYVAHLKEIGFSDGTDFGGIIGRNFESIVWADLNDTFFGVGAKSESANNKYLVQFTSATKTIRSAIERSENPALPPVTISRRVSGDFGCPACEFRDICRKEMESFDNNFGHVTLLSEVTAPKAAEHFSHLEDIRSLAEAEGLSAFGMKSALRAQVWLDKTPRIIDPANPPELATYDVEIDIDLENTQAIFHEAELEEVAVSDRVYLYGYGIHDRTVNPDWKSVELGYFDAYQNTDEGELKVLNSMWQKLFDEVSKHEAAGKSVAIFHYSQHEVTWWRNYAEKYEGQEGVPTEEELMRFINRYFKDLYRETKKIAFPLTGYSIKTLAKAAKFNWQVADAGGGNSLVKFQTAISKLKPKAEQDEAIAWLRSYNADDVRATFAVRNWVRQLSFD